MEQRFEAYVRIAGLYMMDGNLASVCVSAGLKTRLSLVIGTGGLRFYNRSATLF
jgi:hypothetical protein